MSNTIRSSVNPLKPSQTAASPAHPELPDFGLAATPENWEEYDALAEQFADRFTDLFELRQFEYIHPIHLQPETPARFQHPYPVKISYSDWGDPENPVLICCGGVANSAMRFNYLSADLQHTHRIICMDWVGRGLSGWMADQADYSLATCVEQLRQLIEHLGVSPVSLLGSSLGGSAAIELASRHPQLVQQIILNDIGPYIPKERRQRRAETLARHYVFRDPADLMRRVGVSQKNDGPISDDIRFIITFHQTRWSNKDNGRTYRHDVRAMQAYKVDAQQDLDQWHHWHNIRCPVLLIHGLLSNALLSTTITKMRNSHPTMAVMHVPDTGHTPVLCDRHQTEFIKEWLIYGDSGVKEWSVLHAPTRIPIKDKKLLRQQSLNLQTPKVSLRSTDFKSQ
ncbi:alpha/beta fold hydrolase [Motiliproteus sp. MSK22-1]|uniref:alpha/beta fold hydrolase n=1 Tax=Motiliproteus sp. MSK22-1 TaxID=1897630 RepID=UPI0009774647|nr:alpha/beta hydrolase [Motiliproteus sp. MSK22-1]OMH30299.1 hypothetical protein BGP75_18080 [Motiliproteus sp. MSK22-1]